MELVAVTDEQILHVARKILGGIEMRVVRTSDSPPAVFLIAQVQQTTVRWRVRFSAILDDHLAFDRI
jgi:hypothetical protein